MKKEKREELPIFSYTGTPSFMSADQLVNSTANELFSFKDETAKEGSSLIIIQPISEKEKKKNKSQ